ncbi:PQQ-binding-like beta-propeller repeat protein [Candidatus Babeliales bacterium]|nr:PQQ-binding-like beta-propeller repeat protein [Candidatus Babeliales bacterium]
MNQKTTSKKHRSKKMRNVFVILVLLFVLYFVFPMLLAHPFRHENKFCYYVTDVLFAPVEFFYQHVPWYATYIDYQREFLDGIFEKEHQVLRNLPESGWPMKTDGPIFSLPCVTEDSLYFGSCDGCLYRVDKHTGNIIWKITGFERIDSNPIIRKGVVYFMANNSRMYAVSCETGDILWKKWIRGSGYNNPKFFNGNIFLIGYNQLAILSPEDGKIVQSCKIEDDGGAFCTSGNKIAIVVNKGRDYIDSMGKGAVVCYDYDRNVTTWSRKLGGSCFGPLVCDETNCYLGVRNGFFYAIEMQKGSIAWKIDCRGLVDHNPSSGFVLPGDYIIDMGQKIIFSVSCQDVESPAALVCATKSDGKILWTVEHPVQISGAFVLEGNRVIAVTEDCKLLSVNVDTGKSQVFSLLPNNDFGEFAGIIQDEEYLFIVGADAHVWRLNVSDVIIN